MTDRPRLPLVLAVSALLLLTSAASLAQFDPPTFTKKVRPCSPQGCRVPVYLAPGVTTVTYDVIIINNAPFSYTVSLVDDVPPKALGFLVVDRGDGQPCGAPGGPTCSNSPAPSGVNRTGQISISGIPVGPAGSLLGERHLTFEVDFSCPPIANGDLIPNRARLTIPTYPAVCNPCLSEDQITGGPSVFQGRCLPPPEYRIAKTASVSEWRPGELRTIGYRIEVVNGSSTETLIGPDLFLVDWLPTLGSGFPAFDTAATCNPFRVTTNPPAPLSIDDNFCDATSSPYVRIERWADVPPLGSFTLDFTVEMVDGLPDGFAFCNEAFAYYSPTGSATNVSACTRVVIPRDVDFRQSVKSVDPLQAPPGRFLVYTIEVLNSGTSPATGVVLTDVLPACIDASTFDPATDVRVNPGPVPGPATYDGASRTLTVPLPGLGPGTGQTVYIAGVNAGDPVCCNQAVLTSNEVPSPGHVTGGPSGPGERTCYAPVAVDFTTSRKSVAPAPLEEAVPLTYTIAVTNSGADPATRVEVTDILPDCIDASGFDPNAHVSASPGPIASRSYQPAGRLLTLGFGRIGALETQTITVTGLSAGAARPACCNQAFIASAELALGQPTGTAQGPDQPVCAEVVAVGCNLNRAQVPLASPRTPPWVFTNTCSVPSRLPGPAFVPRVGNDVEIDDVSAGGPSELHFYQLDCPCADSISLTRSGGRVRIRY